MLQEELIHKFLDCKTLAVIGVSRKGDIPANHIYKKFKESGYGVFPVNPNAEIIEGDTCYSNLSTLPEKPEAVMLAGRPETSEACIKECIELNVPIIWMHKGIGQGSYSPAAEALARENHIEVISNGCPMMFVGKVDPFHKVLRWFKR